MKVNTGCIDTSSSREMRPSILRQWRALSLIGMIVGSLVVSFVSVKSGTFGPMSAEAAAPVEQWKLAFDRARTRSKSNSLSS